jgi:hypothetical protein
MKIITKGGIMKGKLEDGTPVEIEKPGAIERWTKWWEFVGLREVKTGEIYLYSDNLFTAARDNEHRGLQKEYWIASEIPRASASQLATIGMRERDGRPVKCKEGDCVWTNSDIQPIANIMFAATGSVIGKFRFILEPMGKKEVAGDGYRLLEVGETIKKGDEFKSIFDWTKTEDAGQVLTTSTLSNLTYRRKITQPPRPEKLRFSVPEIIDYCIERQIIPDDRRQGHINEFNHIVAGIKAFTERRRENGN